MERLAQIGQPENGNIAGVDLEVVEDDFFIRVDAGLFRADPEIRFFVIMRRHAAVGADIDFFAIDFLECELARFEDDRIHRRAHVGCIEELSLVVINCAVAATEAVGFVGRDISREGHRLGDEVDHCGVGEDFEAVVASDFDGAAEDDLIADIAAHCAAEVFDIEFLGNGAAGVGEWRERG